MRLVLKAGVVPDDGTDVATGVLAPLGVALRLPGALGE